MDVVYVHKQKQSLEIVYSIKSLKNITHGNIYVVGDNPKIDGVIHIPHIKDKWACYSKYHDQISKYLQICNNPEISDDFIAMNDDMFIMQKIELVIYNRGTIAEHIKERSTYDQYSISLKTTENYLLKNKLDTVDYELHTPFIYNKEKLKAVIDKLNKEPQFKYQIRTIYGNTYNIPSTYRKDVKNNDSYGDILSTSTILFNNGDIGEYIRQNV